MVFVAILSLLYLLMIRVGGPEYNFIAKFAASLGQ